MSAARWRRQLSGGGGGGGGGNGRGIGWSLMQASLPKFAQHRSMGSWW